MRSILFSDGFIHVAKNTFIVRLLFLVSFLSVSSQLSVYLIRRNTSVDESYEWDAADACLDSEVLEATKFDQSQAGFQQSRRELGSDQTGGLRDQQQKGDLFILSFF